MDTKGLIARAKRGAGDPDMTDSDLARMLGISSAALAQYKRDGFSDPIALKIAKLAKLPADVVLIHSRTLRERDPEVKSALGAALRKLVTTAVAAVLGMSAALGPKPATAGGEGGIRTHGTVTGTPDFESGTFDHSATSPGTTSLRSSRAL